MKISNLKNAMLKKKNNKQITEYYHITRYKPVATKENAMYVI